MMMMVAGSNTKNGLRQRRGEGVLNAKIPLYSSPERERPGESANCFFSLRSFSPPLRSGALLSPPSVVVFLPGKKIICCIASACSVGMQRGEGKGGEKEK